LVKEIGQDLSVELKISLVFWLILFLKNRMSFKLAFFQKSLTKKFFYCIIW